MKTKSLFLSIVTLALSGCLATLQPQSSDGPKPAAEGASAETKDSKTELSVMERPDFPVVDWNVAQLQEAKTIFVPAVFSSSQKGMLYIGGQPVLFNNMPQADVLGFIQSAKKTTFYVAVAAPRKLVQTNNRTGGNSLIDPETLKGLSPQEQLRMMEAAATLQKAQGGVSTTAANTQSANANGFYVGVYEVDDQRRVLRELNGFETATPGAWVGRDGLFVATPVPGTKRLVNYQGYNPQGQIVNGPTNVLWASPAPIAGDWYFFRPDPSHRGNLLEETAHEWGSWSAARGFKVESSVMIRKTSFMQFVNTTGIFVDTPPVADTVRTGAATFVFSEGNSEVVTSRIIDSFIHVYLFGVPTPKRRQIDCFGLCNRDTTLISHKAIKAGTSDRGSAFDAGETGVFFASRGFLTGEGESTIYFNQSEKNSFGALVFGGVSTKDQEPIVVYDEITGAGLNSVRKFMFAGSGNTSAMSKSRNAFGVPYFFGDNKQPSIIVHSRLNKPVIGFDTKNSQRLRSNHYVNVAGQFGIELR